MQPSVSLELDNLLASFVVFLLGGVQQHQKLASDHEVSGDNPFCRLEIIVGRSYWIKE